MGAAARPSRIPQPPLPKNGHPIRPLAPARAECEDLPGGGIRRKQISNSVLTEAIGIYQCMNAIHKPGIMQFLIRGVKTFMR